MDNGDSYSAKNKVPGIKRMKISRACDECRKRKVKCDGVHPCGRCKKSNIECVFAKLPPKRGPPKQYIDGLENRLQRVEKALRTIHDPRLYDETMNLNKEQEVCSAAPYSCDMALSPMDRYTINEIGQALYVNDFKQRVDRIPNENHLNDSQSDIASISDSPLSSHASFFHATVINTPLEPILPDHLSSRPMITEIQPLMEIYFDHVHKYVPMIHKPSFLKQLHSTQPPSRFLLHSMAAVAEIWSPEHLNYEGDMSHPIGYSHYQKALDILDDLLDAPRLSTVQGLILLIKYQETYTRKGYLHRTSFYLQLAVRMGLDLGLPEIPNGDTIDMETKRRTFWVLFLYDLLINIEQGRPTHLNVHQCSTGFPLVTGEEGPALEELITNQNILIQLGRVLSPIYFMSRLTFARQQYKGSTLIKDRVVEEQSRLFSLHSHLENFLYEVPPTLIYPPTQDTDNYPAEKQQIGDPFIAFLHMTYHFGILLLHRDYIHHPPPKTEFNFVPYPHRRLCASSASNITFIADTLLEMYPEHTLHYPIRGVQHILHCLSTAVTIHEYEMSHAEAEATQIAAKEQYILTRSLIRSISHLSPMHEKESPAIRKRSNTSSSSISTVYNQYPTNYNYPLQWTQDTPIQNYRYSQPVMNWSQSCYTQPVYTNNRNRRHTVSYPSAQYPNYYSTNTASTETSVDVKHTDKQPVMAYNNMPTMVMEDTFMLETPLYDPSNGMSQLFLTDDQLWDRTDSIRRSEGHVMK